MVCIEGEWHVGDSDEEANAPRKRAPSRGENRLPVLLQILTLSKQISAAELSLLQEQASIDSKNVERILLSYLDMWVLLV